MTNIFKITNLSILTLGASLICSGFNLAQAASITGDKIDFTLGGGDNFGSDPVELDVTIEDLGNDLKFSVDVVPESVMGNIADLRGVFLDIADESLLSGLSFSGADITNSNFDANDVINLRGGNNLNGGGTAKFDIGFTFGSSGIGSDDIRSTMFTLSHTSADLSLNLFANQRFGARLTSTGVEGGSRGGSSKIVATIPNSFVGGDPTDIPEPNMAIALGLLTIGSFLTTRKKKI